MKVEFYKHNIEEQDIEEAKKVLKSLFLTTGPKVEEFERLLAQTVGTKYAVGVTSCTEALILSLKAVGVKPGTNVITSPLTFASTANSILHLGAELKFCDVLPETGCIDPNQIKTQISPNTKAIIPIHLYGELCNMNEIMQLANENACWVVEDAAHALETKGIGQGVFACFSFYPIKSITCGEGGAIVTDSLRLAEFLKIIRLHGMTKSAWSRYSKAYSHWDLIDLGFKSNMTDISAALLTSQLMRIEEITLSRISLYLRYKDLLKDIEEVQLLNSSQGSSKLMFTILVPKEKRDNILWKLQGKGVGVAVNFRPVHLLSYYKETFGYKEGDFPIAEDIGSRTITLPLYPKLTFEEQDYVVSTLKDILRSKL